MIRNQVLNEKLPSVRQYLQQKELQAIFVMKRAHFSWLTNGAHNHIPHHTNLGEAGILVSEEQFVVITNNIEYPRLKQEELYDLDVDYEVYSWYEPLEDVLKKFGDPSNIAVDCDLEGFTKLESDFNQLRYELTSYERDSLRSLGIETAKTVESLCFQLQKGMTEREIKAQIHKDLYAKKMEPTVVLVAHDERVAHYRHPLPTDHSLNQLSMIVVCARQNGLIVALTRLVHLGHVPESLRVKHKGVNYVHSIMQHMSRPGVSFNTIFEHIKEAYTKVNAHGEWKLHHQGGPIGYENREFLVNDSTDECILENQAIAWNPSITGTKTEDTILVGTNENQIITQTGDWPVQTFSIEGKHYDQPEILQV